MKDDLDVEEIKGQIMELQQREEQLTKELTKLENYIKSIGKQVDVSKFKDLMKGYIQKDYFTFEDKRFIIRSIVKQITVIDKDNIRIEVL